MYFHPWCKLCDNSSDKIRKNQKKWRENNKEKIKAQKKAYELAHPGRHTALKMFFLYKKMNRIPLWANKEDILQIYCECPQGHEVDHIVPLKGQNVCGLHVEYNLQYLTPHENRAKGKKFEDTDYRY